MKSEPPIGKPKTHYTMSAAALASRRANLERARAAPHEKIYRATEKRQAASRANLAKAIAARKTPRGNASARLNALHDGLFVRDVARSVRRMGEDPAEFRDHHNLFLRVFAPLDEQERAWVLRIADLSWKRLRYFRALARWELEALMKGFSTIPRAAPIGAKETELRALYLARLFARFADRIDPLTRFQSRIDREIRKLLRRRSGGTFKYRGYYPPGGLNEPDDAMIDKMLDDALKKNWG